jgi:hypothetical protein
MTRRTLLGALVFTWASLFAVPARALDHPVYVTVAGQGAIRFQLWIDRVPPEHGGLFDGWLTPGSYVFETGAYDVGYRFTSGYFRETNWSTPQRIATRLRFGRPAVIELRTD